MKIAFKKPFELEIEPKVPLRLLQKVEQSLPMARAVSVVREHDSKQRTINAFRLTSGEGPRPKETSEDVAQGICNVMQWEALRCLEDEQLEAVGEGLTFIVKVTRFQGQKRATFRYVWKLDEDAGQADDFDDADDSELDDLDENSHRYLRGIIGQQQVLVDRFMYQTEMLLKANADMAERTQKPLELVGQQLGFANSILMQGMQAMVTSMQTVYSHEANKETEKAKTERFNTLMEKATTYLGPVVQIGAQQLMKYVAKKSAGESGPTPRGRDIVREQARRRSATEPPHAPAPPTPPPTPEAAPATAEPETQVEEFPDDPLHHCVATFADSISTPQRKAIRKQFKAGEMRSFVALIEADDGDEVRKAFASLRKSLGGDLTKLMGALGIFTEQQQQLIMHVVAECMEIGEEGDES